MRELRIVFMGTPQFAVTVLDKILAQGHSVVGVITAPDKPAGRGRKLQESAVKKYATSRGLLVLQPDNLKSLEFIENLKALKSNLQVVVAFRMLPEIVWKLPTFGTFNLHASLLPHYRGAAPINWAIINGESTSGVTTFFINDKIDTGEIILQQEIPIGTDDNAGDLHDKLMNVGANLVIETLGHIEQNTVRTVKQEECDQLKDAPKLTRENTRIDWQAPLKTIYNQIRGLDPYPSAWSLLKNGEEEVAVKIYTTEMIEDDHNWPSGTVIQENKILKVAVAGGYIKICQIQLPGKRKMEASELLNGYEFETSAKLV